MLLLQDGEGVGRIRDSGMVGEVDALLSGCWDTGAPTLEAMTHQGEGGWWQKPKEQSHNRSRSPRRQCHKERHTRKAEWAHAFGGGMCRMERHACMHARMHACIRVCMHARVRIVSGKNIARGLSRGSSVRYKCVHTVDTVRAQV